MTREEALEAVKEVAGTFLPWDRHYEGLQMAIAALSVAGEKTADLIDRQAAIEEIDKARKDPPLFTDSYESGMLEARGIINLLPAAGTEPLSDAYMKAVWTWLINYQIRVAELKGSYAPYEVLSWVANDWRKEHGLNQQASGD